MRLTMSFDVWAIIILLALGILLEIYNVSLASKLRYANSTIDALRQVAVSRQMQIRELRLQLDAMQFRRQIADAEPAPHGLDSVDVRELPLKYGIGKIVDAFERRPTSAEEQSDVRVAMHAMAQHDPATCVICSDPLLRERPRDAFFAQHHRDQGNEL
jgi:hypothetical protein